MKKRLLFQIPLKQNYASTNHHNSINMSIIDALNWRYATKRMNGNIIPKEKMDVILTAIALAPSSLGLQPYSVIVIENSVLLEKIKPVANMQPQITEASALLVFAAWDNLTEERIDAYIKRISTVRNVSENSLKRIKEMTEVQLKNSAEQNFIWNSKQGYIALGIGLVAAAEGNIDSTPMEGFNHEQVDEILQLKEKGLKSTVFLALGYRDAANDYLVKLKKVRRENDKLFTTIQ
ncbi:MAG: NAD(P)H-dependent oxidoreductase [Flavobacterium sp.]